MIDCLNKEFYKNNENDKFGLCEQVISYCMVIFQELENKYYILKKESNY